jgi:hypothetical protein
MNTHTVCRSLCPKDMHLLVSFNSSSLPLELQAYRMLSDNLIDSSKHRLLLTRVPSFVYLVNPTLEYTIYFFLNLAHQHLLFQLLRAFY